MKFKYYFLFLIILCYDLNEILGASRKPTYTDEPRVSTINKIKEMCTKYKDLKYRNITIPGSLPGDTPQFYSKLDCQHMTPLVVGGENAKSKEFPHMALIGYGETKEDIQWNCGGSLISDRFVLSTAHCNHGSYGKPTWVRLGKLNLITTNKDVEDPHDYEIMVIHDHPRYKVQDSYHDITLYELQIAVKFSPFIRPLCLYPYASFQNGTETVAYVTGWGQMGAGDKADVLQKAKVKIVKTKKCERSFDNKVQKFSNGFLSVFQLCAGDLQNGSDTCQGDSGGPLQMEIPNEICMFYQIGITSVGKLECGDKIHPAVYTKLWRYLNWIQALVWPN